MHFCFSQHEPSYQRTVGKSAICPYSKEQTACRWKKL
jgi:hypothetical protein